MQPARGEVHSWCVALDASPETSAGLYTTLSGEEQDRSSRFRFERDRRRYVVAHGALRELLGHYLGAAPGQLRFGHNAFGKPELSPEFGSRLRFNLSHSGDYALIGIAADADIGVDIEHIRAMPDHADIARRFFSAAVVDRLNRLPSHLKARGFFSCWTKTEAYLKARGEGLGLDRASGDANRARRWSICSLLPAPGYIGAVVVEGSGWRLLDRDYATKVRPPEPLIGVLSHIPFQRAVHQHHHRVDLV